MYRQSLMRWSLVVILAAAAPVTGLAQPGPNFWTMNVTPMAGGHVQIQDEIPYVEEFELRPVGYSCDGFCTFVVAQGSNWTLTSTGVNGSVLSDWTGCDATPGDGSCTLNVVGERLVKGRFKYPLTVTNGSSYVNLWVDVER